MSITPQMLGAAGLPHPWSLELWDQKWIWGEDLLGTWKPLPGPEPGKTAGLGLGIRLGAHRGEGKARHSGQG